MIPPAPVDRRRRVIVAALVVGLIVAGSVAVSVVTHGGLGYGPAYPPGTTLEVPGGSTSNISVTGDHLEIVLETSAGAGSASLVVGSDGFRRDFRASPATYGLRLDTAAALQTGTRRLTLVIPESGTLILTIVGGGQLVMNQVRLKELRVTGVSSLLELDASKPGSSVDLLQIESATGGLSAVRLGNLNMAELVIGNITGRYDVDLSGSLNRYCEATLRSVVGSGTLRVPGSVGAQVVVRSIVGSVLSAGFVDEGNRSYVNRLAEAKASLQLVVHVESAIGQIRLMEVQQ